ncbi:hypothetical protein [Salinicoccus sp. YB14-2]|uniref:hypothetical protein n=1 Tax=Salinicoccus sp. YB14-2 TaxID=1572701 RepID=UPI000689DFF3|nr:hypothetical protein [Salinicoccus sp. YB14-2]
MNREDKRLTNTELEAMFAFWLIGAFMAIRGITLVLTTQERINNSDLYSTMDSILPFPIWGVIFVIAALIIAGSSVSQTVKKYYGLLVGNFLGVLVGFPFSIMSVAESHMPITQYTITLVAFFNLVLFVHAGVSIWREKKRIHSLRKSN